MTMRYTTIRVGPGYVEIQVEVKTRRTYLWVVLCGWMAWLIGRERAARWAWSGCWKLARWRVKSARGGTSWQRFTPEQRPPNPWGAA